MILRILTLAFTVAALPFASVSPGHAAAPSPLGVWLNPERDAHVEIRRCGETLCGHIVWLAHADARDKNNVDPAKRDRPLLGVQVLWNISQEPDDPARWGNGGRLYDPRDYGDDFPAEIRMQDANTMAIRGCTWLICSEWNYLSRVGP
jgi:uncharacterized protein (DUF2147 family)